MQHEIVGTKGVSFVATVGANENDGLFLVSISYFPTRSTVRVRPVHVCHHDVRPIDSTNTCFKNLSSGHAHLFHFLREKHCMPASSQCIGKSPVELALCESEQRAGEVNFHLRVLLSTHMIAATASIITLIIAVRNFFKSSSLY